LTRHASSIESPIDSDKSPILNSNQSAA